MKELEPKKVHESAIEDHAHKIFSADLNSRGTVFGGLIMSTLDRLASIVAELHSGHVCVTASVDALHFIAPAGKGDILIFKCSVNRAWKSSMEIGTRVIAHDAASGEERHIVSAYFTFVALDGDGLPTRVPPILPETKDQKRRFEEADLRRNERMKMVKVREEIKARYHRE